MEIFSDDIWSDSRTVSLKAILLLDHFVFVLRWNLSPFVFQIRRPNVKIGSIFEFPLEVPWKDHSWLQLVEFEIGEIWNLKEWLQKFDQFAEKIRIWSWLRAGKRQVNIKKTLEYPWDSNCFEMNAFHWFFNLRQSRSHNRNQFAKNAMQSDGHQLEWVGARRKS
jgi:hypothetical protein